MSWKTSLFGLLAAIGGGILAAMQTGTIDPATLPPWVKSVAVILSIVGTAGVGLFARDNNKTSEDVNAGRRNGQLPLLLFALCVLPLFIVCSGCAVVAQTSTSRPDGTNGVVTVAKSRIIAFGDARQMVDKVRASAGKTSSVGASGVDQESSLTNAATIISATAEGVTRGLSRP